jgi:MoaA/NifB/PqqE/SkfB family radical SAM enzyme
VKNGLIKKTIEKHYKHIPKIILRHFFTPKNLVIEPIAGCNVVCSACPQDQLRRPYGKMSFNDFKTIIRKMKPTSIGLYFMGEPFLNRKIFDMIKHANHKRIKTSVNTNGSTLLMDYDKIMNSGLDKIAVSIDGYTQETFEMYRHGINRDYVYDGLKLLSMVHSHVESKTHIQVRTLAFESTMREISLIQNEMDLMNILDHRIIEPIITGWGGKENLDLDKLGSSGRVKDTRPLICPSLFRMAVTWDGWVLPCCNDVHGENKFGNIFRDSYMNIMWGSGMWRKKANRCFGICGNCYEGDDS